MAGFEVGDKVVYPPHGAGTVVARQKRDGDEYLSIDIAHSKMTLMVPASTATDKGVRPVISARAADKLLKELGGEAAVLLDNPQHRARQAADDTRGGSADTLAAILRDFTGRSREGKKLSLTEQRSMQTAQLMLASEIALAKGIDIDEASRRIDDALGVESE